MERADEVNSAIELKAKMEVAAKEHKELGYCIEYSNQKKRKGSSRNFKEVSARLRNFSTSHCYYRLPKTTILQTEIFDEERKTTLFSGNIFAIDNTTIRTLYDRLPQSGFGNVREQKTDVDVAVRNAKEASQFEIEGDVFSKVSIRMLESFTEYEVVPYKFNIYGPQGHFSKHKDTPETGLLATLLIGIYCDTKHNTHLKLYSDPIFNWQLQRRDVFCFYPDVPHKVKKTNSFRMTLACKVFAKNKIAPIPLDIKTITTLQMLYNLILPWEPNYGFILRHKYSITETTAWKPQDQLLLHVIQRIVETKAQNWKLEFVPVVIVYHSEGDEYGEDEDAPFIEQLQVKHILKQHKYLSDIQFYFLYDNGETWSRKTEEACEYTGNESRPASVDSIYVNFALIVHDQDPNEKGGRLEEPVVEELDEGDEKEEDAEPI